MLKRGIVEVITEDEFERLISSGKPLNIKFGVDPTSPDIHLGHLVLFRKLKEFQELDHTIILIIGDFTARIGDPTGRDKTRPSLSEDKIRENALTYAEQVFKILSPEKTKILYNSSWFNEISLQEFIHLSFSYTVSRMLERDDFTLRYKQGNPITLAEFLYPLLQGYDSFMVKADIEIGGSDQKFNMLVGREIQKHYSQIPQVVLTMPLLEGRDGKLKMSKSYNNYIGIKESPQEIFGKIMSIPDSVLIKYYELLTDEDLEKIKKEISENPFETKKKLAFMITSFCHSEKEAEKAKDEFERVFSKRETPEKMSEYRISSNISLVTLMYNAGLTKSKSEAIRLIKQNGVKLGREVVKDTELEVSPPEEPIILKVGKRRFLKIIK